MTKGGFSVNDHDNGTNYKNFIGRVKKKNRAVRAARSHEQVRAVLCKTTREITTFTVLMTT